MGYGPNLQAWAVYLMVVHFIPVRRCVRMLQSLTGATPSPGFAHAVLSRAAALTSEAGKWIRTLITLACAVCCDETPLRVGPRKPKPGRTKADKYLLVACTERWTHYQATGSLPRPTRRRAALRRRPTGSTHAEPGRTRPTPGEDPAEDPRTANQRATDQGSIQNPRPRLQRGEEQPRQDAGPARRHARTPLDAGPTHTHPTPSHQINISRRPTANRPTRYATTRHPYAHHLNVCGVWPRRRRRYWRPR